MPTLLWWLLWSVPWEMTRLKFSRYCFVSRVVSSLSMNLENVYSKYMLYERKYYNLFAKHFCEIESLPYIWISGALKICVYWHLRVIGYNLVEKRWNKVFWGSVSSLAKSDDEITWKKKFYPSARNSIVSFKVLCWFSHKFMYWGSCCHDSPCLLSSVKLKSS